MKKITFIILIASLFLSDFVFLSFDTISILSVWREVISVIFVGYLFLVTVLSVRFNKSIYQKHRYQLALIFFFIILYLFCGDFSEASAKSFKALSSPILISLIVVSMLEAYSLEYKLKLIFKNLILLSLISGVYAAYQYIHISDVSEFWYWDLLVDKGYELQSYNSIREGVPRMSGFFTGTLEFSAVILNSAILILSILLQKIKRGQIGGVSIVLLAALIFCSILICYGTVRTSLIGLISTSLFLMILQLVKSKYWVTFYGYMYFLALTAAIFLYLVFGYTNDLSAMDRVRQWLDVFALTGAKIFGYGFSEIGPGRTFWFDSFWLNLVAGCGILGGGVMIALILLYKKIINSCDRLRKWGGIFESGFADYLIAIYPFYLSSFFFQSYTNSIALYLFSITVLVIIYDVRFNTSKISYNHCSL